VLFWLGAHRPYWLEKTAVPLMVSTRLLSSRKSLPRALGPWVLDSGGFSELSLYGEWRTTPKDYVVSVRRYQAEIGGMQWAAAQDWMTELPIRAKTGLSVRTHQALTVANYLELLDRAPEVPWLPVLQGQTPADYLRHVEAYQRAGVPLQQLWGLGSVCRRQSLPEIRYVARTLRHAGLRLHGFGVKTAGLASLASILESSDSMAWGTRALNDVRRGRSSSGANYPCPVGSGQMHTVKSGCANCLRYALQWRGDVVRSLSQSTEMFGELTA
jgi:hypothetical protein